ncbi:unnamed protein product, partial [Iphiclides podalirius]
MPIKENAANRLERRNFNRIIVCVLFYCHAVERSSAAEMPHECAYRSLEAEAPENAVLFCKIRTISSLEHLLQNISRTHFDELISLHVQCSEILFFESTLTARADKSSGKSTNLSKLRDLVIDKCKIRQIPARAFENFKDLKRLHVTTHNSEWSAMTMELHEHAFSGAIFYAFRYDVSDWLYTKYGVPLFKEQSCPNVDILDGNPNHIDLNKVIFIKIVDNNQINDDLGFLLDKFKNISWNDPRFWDRFVALLNSTDTIITVKGSEKSVFKKSLRHTPTLRYTTMPVSNDTCSKPSFTNSLQYNKRNDGDSSQNESSPSSDNNTYGEGNNSNNSYMSIENRTCPRFNYDLRLSPSSGHVYSRVEDISPSASRSITGSSSAKGRTYFV